MGLKLLHVTASDNLDGIRADGVTGLSYWAVREDIHAYYVETVEDEEKEPVTLMVDLDDLDPNLLEPDHPGLEEPITTVLGMSEDEVWEEWQETDQSWNACLDLIGTVRYRGIIPADKIQVGELSGALAYEGRPLIDASIPTPGC